MNWKKELIQYENTEQWQKAIDLMEDIIKKYPDNVEVYVRYIYLLHYILLESTDPILSFQNPHVESLLIKYFNDGNKKFSENAEYLFFIGTIIHIAEWYFGLNDEDKPAVERLAFQMQQKALDLESSNILYKWGFMHSYSNDKLTINILREKILDSGYYVDWLKSKGFPGDYILNVQLG